MITRKQSEESSKFHNSRAIYLFNLNKRFDLDGDFKFNTARLINHSCEPNCEVTGSGLKVWVYAIKDIKKDDELSYDYGFSYDKDYKQFPCKCGTKNCIGYIVNFTFYFFFILDIEFWVRNKRIVYSVIIINNFFFN